MNSNASLERVIELNPTHLVPTRLPGSILIIGAGVASGLTTACAAGFAGDVIQEDEIPKITIRKRVKNGLDFISAP